jgi:TolB protein
MMPKHVSLLTAALIAFAALAVAGVTSDWEEYTDNELHVAFSHPKDWKPSPQYSDRTYFGGPDGEVQLDASEGDSPEKVCRGAASHKLQPFGSHPQIKPITVGGHKGCIVWGSDDQGAPYYAELVVPFPRPLEIKGDRYNLLTLHADKRHILDIIKTLKFLPK